MKALLQLEEVGLLVLGIVLYLLLSYPIWLFFALLLAPDIGMLGYLLNDRVGAWSYNFFHHRGVAIVVYLSGMFSGIEELQLAGIIVFTHIAIDRALGYGLKYEKGFKFTHLGRVGKKDG
ncbi:MAG: DUF4260 domain-containing protein [Bacteroidota bacterium]